MSTISVGDASLYFRETGSGSPLLLIHGSGGHADLFDKVGPLLAERHRVIVYDRRGHSRSGSKPAPVTGHLKRQAEDAAGLLRGLNASPATVIGWSSGGLIALCLAVEHPDLVERLIVCEPPLYASKHVPPSSIWPFLKTQFLAAIGRKQEAMATVFRMLLAQPDGSNGYDQLDSETREGILVNADILLHELKTGSGEELTADRIRQLSCPVSAILGDATAAVFADATQRLSNLLPELRIERIAGAGHISVLTHPVDFARIVSSACSPRGLSAAE